MFPADNIVMFNPLQLSDLIAIVDSHVQQLSKRLASQRIGLTISPAAARVVLQAAYDPSFGARPLRRYVTNVLGTEVSKLIVSGAAKPSSTIAFDANSHGDGLFYSIIDDNATK